MTKKPILSVLHILEDTMRVLKENDPLRMAGATAFFSTFALPPILMIIVRALGLFFNRKEVGRELLQKLGGTIGQDGSQQVLSTIRGILALQENQFITTGIFIFLLFVATTLFKIIKSSLNQLWNIRVTAGRSIKLLLLTRLHAVAVILFAGALFVAVLVLDGIQAWLGKYISLYAPDISPYLNGALNTIVSVIIVTLWFLMLFWYLPDGRPKLKVAVLGAIVTSVLFNIGKFILRSLLSSSNIGNLYGTAGALVLVLLFVFYSSFILYFGASFIKVWAQHTGGDIEPLPHASRYALSVITVKEGNDAQ
ncbi:MAG: YihY/virulence factor BrkB family protein [Sphingobacteriales bacterium]|nr:MAG: YihY/virulence factor BrkB family protein [Sphingobacteriales bacterium]